MNSNAQKWVEALRSGEYMQGRGYLTKHGEDGDKDCCLGVACKVFLEENPNKLDVETKTVGFGKMEIAVYGETISYYLPPEVRDWLELQDEEGRFESKEGSQWLTVLNDTGYSFEEIAAIIESQPEGLFR